MEKIILILELIIITLLSFFLVQKNNVLGASVGYRASLQVPYITASATSTGGAVIATSTFMVNFTTSTFNNGRAYIDSSGNGSVSGTWQAYGLMNALGGLTVTGACTGCGGGGASGITPFSPTSSFISALTVTNGSGTSTLGANYLAINTTTLNASGTAYIGYAGDITASGSMRIYSSSTFNNALTVSGALQASGTLQTSGAAIFNGVTSFPGTIGGASEITTFNFQLRAQVYQISGRFYVGSTANFGATNIPAGGTILQCATPCYFTMGGSGDVGAVMIDDPAGDNRNIYFGLGDRNPTDHFVLFDGAMRVGDGTASTTASGTMLMVASSTANRAGTFAVYGGSGNVFASGTLNFQGGFDNNLTIGSTVSTTGGTLSLISRNYVVSTTGDMFFNSSTAGGGSVVLRATDNQNTCHRIQVNNANTLSAVTVTCPTIP